MNLTTLDLDTLRALVVANDLGGYGQAGNRLGRTPSAISLQMKRLQSDVGARLFRKHGRTLALTEAGETVLRYARRMLALNDELLATVRDAEVAGTVGLGCPQDFAEAMLPAVLTQFTRLYPAVQFEVRIEGNAALVEAVGRGQLDLALAIGHADRPTARVLGALDLVWIAGREFRWRRPERLPLVLLGPQCAFRKHATERLDAASIAWRLAAISPSLSGLWASALGALGVTARSAMGLPAGLIWGPTLFGLPALGSFPVTLHSRPAGRRAGAEQLHAVVSRVVVEALAASERGARPRSGSSRQASPARASSARPCSVRTDASAASLPSSGTTRARSGT